MVNYMKESALKVAKSTLKASLKDFNIQIESSEQAVQDQKKEQSGVASSIEEAAQCARGAT